MEQFCAVRFSFERYYLNFLLSNTHAFYLLSDLIPPPSFSDRSIDGGKNPQEIKIAGIEANLDIQYTVGLVNGGPVEFFRYLLCPYHLQVDTPFTMSAFANNHHILVCLFLNRSLLKIAARAWPVCKGLSIWLIPGMTLCEITNYRRFAIENYIGLAERESMKTDC